MGMYIYRIYVFIMHVHVYICIYMYMYIYTYLYSYTYIHTHTHTYIHVYICICILFICMYVYIYLSVYVLWMYLDSLITHVNTHKNTQILPCVLQGFFTKNSARTVIFWNVACSCCSFPNQTFHYYTDGRKIRQNLLSKENYVAPGKAAAIVFDACFQLYPSRP